MNLSSSSLTSSSSSLSSSTATSWLSSIVRGRSDKSTSTVKMSSTSISAGGDSVGPNNRKNQFRGVLYKYGPKPIQVVTRFWELELERHWQPPFCFWSSR